MEDRVEVRKLVEDFVFKGRRLGDRPDIKVKVEKLEPGTLLYPNSKGQWSFVMSAPGTLWRISLVPQDTLLTAEKRQLGVLRDLLTLFVNQTDNLVRSSEVSRKVAKTLTAVRWSLRIPPKEIAKEVGVSYRGRRPESTLGTRQSSKRF
jgi:hypothetical protein